MLLSRQRHNETGQRDSWFLWFIFTLKPLESLETKVVDLTLKRRNFLQALTLSIKQNYKTQKLSTLSEHLYFSDKAIATFVSSEIGGRWPRRYQPPVLTPRFYFTCIRTQHFSITKCWNMLPTVWNRSIFWHNKSLQLQCYYTFCCSFFTTFLIEKTFLRKECKEQSIVCIRAWMFINKIVLVVK